MNIEELFSTSERIKILNFAVYRKENLNVNKAAKELKLSKGLISKFFDILTKEKILKRNKNDFIVNQDNPSTKAMKILLNINNLDLSALKKYSFVKSSGIYGSVAKGTNTEESDIDIWILVDKANEEFLARLTSQLKKTNSKINPLYLTHEKLLKIKKEDSLFYNSLFFGSMNIYGEGIEKI